MDSELLKEDVLLQVVHLLHRLQQLHLITYAFSHADQRTYILGKAAAAVATAGVEKAAPDAGVTTHAATHHVHIGPHPLAQVGDVVHKADAGGEHRVGGILCHLR